VCNGLVVIIVRESSELCIEMKHKVRHSSKLIIVYVGCLISQKEVSLISINESSKISRNEGSKISIIHRYFYTK